MTTGGRSQRRNGPHFLRAVWRATFCVVSTLGLLCASFAWGLPGLLALVATVATFAGVSGGVALVDGDRRQAAAVVRRTFVAGGFLVAAAGLVAALHATGFFVALLVGLSSPGAVSRVRRRFAPAETAANHPTGPSAAPPRRADDLPAPGQVPAIPRDVVPLDDEELCLAWRRSFVLLSMATSTAEKMLVVERRARILDELHRRSPDAITTWWRSGGRSSSSPLPYLGHDHGRTDPGAP